MKQILLKTMMLMLMLMVGMGVWAETKTGSWDLTSSSSDWTASLNETYFSQPYGYKKANGTLTNKSISDFSTSGITQIKVGFKCLQNGATTSKLTIYLVDKDGKTLGSGVVVTPDNKSAASQTTYKYATFTTDLTGATGFMMKVTTFGKNILINGAEYEVTYTSGGGSNSDPVDATWSVDPTSVSVRATKSSTATITSNYDGTLSVTSNNTGVATATINGKVITVTGVAEGSTTLTVTGDATSSYNAISKTINVTVTPNVATPGTYDITPNNVFFNCNAFTTKPNGFTSATGEQDDITIVYTAASNAYINASQARAYSGTKLTFSVPTGFDITAISFTKGSDWSGTHTASVGTMTNNMNWTGAANEVTITFKGTCQINSISVTYKEHVAPTETYTVTFDAGTNGTCATSELTEASNGAGVILPEATPNARYDFVGWSTSSTPTSANAGVAGDTYHPTENCTLYAYYTKQIPSYSGAHVDFDLSTDNTATASADEMTWVNALVNIAVAKGSGDKATNANNYYPGTAGQSYKSTRFYIGSTLTFAPATGVTITGIEFTTTTEAYATAFGNSTWTNGDAVADATNKIAYVTPINGTSAVSATIGGTTGGTKLRVYYTCPATVDVTIGATGYATFYAPYNMDFEGTSVTAFLVSPDIENNVVRMTSVDKVPAGTALVVKGTSASVPTTESAAPVTTALEVSATETAYDNVNTYYYLGVDNGTVGFRPLAEGGSIAAGKCFFKVAKTSASPRWFAIADEETAIKSISAIENGAIYNMAGQRVGNDYKGIVIKNGKKVLVK